MPRPPFASIVDRIPEPVFNGAVPPTPQEARLLGIRAQLAGRTDYNSLHGLQENLRETADEIAGVGGNPAPISEIRSTSCRPSRTRRGGRPGPRAGTSLYGDARRAYRTDSDILDAAEYGRTLFDKGLRPDEFQLRWRDLSAEERQAIRMGSRDPSRVSSGRPATTSTPA